MNQTTNEKSLVVVEALTDAKRRIKSDSTQYDPGDMYLYRDIDKAIRVAEIEANGMALLRIINRNDDEINALLAEHAEAIK